MMRVPHSARGLDALRRRLVALPSAARAAILPALEAVADNTAGEIGATLATHAHGGPSRAGSPPSDPSGRLAASITVESGEQGSTVTVATPIAHFLEYGTARMAARPFLRPAGRRAGAAAKALLAAALRKGLAP